MPEFGLHSARHGACCFPCGMPTNRRDLALISCGILAPVLYVVMTLTIGRLWDGYSITSQTISELAAIDAPTRPLWLLLALMYSGLMIAFGGFVWAAAPPNRALRAVGGLLAIQAVFGIFWPPMHQRAVLAAGGGTLTDTLHIVWTIVTSLFFMAAMAFGAAALGTRFRAYSIATMVIVFACGAWTGTYAPRLQANLPTPGAGVWERINTTAFMVWVAVLAAALLRRGADRSLTAHAADRWRSIGPARINARFGSFVMRRLRVSRLSSRRSPAFTLHARRRETSQSHRDNERRSVLVRGVGVRGAIERPSQAIQRSGVKTLGSRSAPTTS